MPVVDTLITRYEADNRGYVAGAGQVFRASNMAAGAIRGVGEVARSFAMAAVAAGAAAGGFALHAMKSAAAFDTMVRKFAGAFGSMDAAKATMEDLELYATKSAFSLEALADAATMLAVAGLDVKRFLPLVERFALVVGGVDPQGLKQVAGALMRAKGGAFGEAMEIFRRAGIGSPELRAQGLTVTRGGEIKATSGEFMAALERASEPLKRIADAVTGGAENTMANVGDAMGRAVRVFGAELNERLMPKVKEFVDALTTLVEDGTVGVLADGFADMADAMTGGGGMLDAMRSLAAQMYTLGRYVEDFGAFWGSVLDNFRKWMRMPSRSPIETGVKAGLMLPAMAADALGEYAKAVRGEFEAGLPARNKKQAGRTGGAALVPEPQVPSQAERHLAAIEENTRRMVDMQKLILGGGELGAAGVSPVRIAQGGAGSPRVQRAVALLLGELAELSRRPGVAAR